MMKNDTRWAGLVLLAAMLILWCARTIHAAEAVDPSVQIKRLGRGVSILGYDPLWDSFERRRFMECYFKLIHDAGGLTQQQLWKAYEAELERLRAIPRGSGGDFHLTQAARVSKRFARALVVSTLEGQTLHRDAFRLLGFSKLATFQQLGRSLGVVV